MRVLYEADTPEGRTELGSLVEVPAFWRYRSHISLEHLEQVFNQQENQGPGARTKEQFALLQLFLQQVRGLLSGEYGYDMTSLRQSYENQNHPVVT